MANGYIGKISAVVTANTSDLSRKLQGAVKDVDRFAQTLNRSVSASAQQATASLEKIFTPLQRLERRLQTALRFNIRTAAEVREIQSLTQAAEQLNKPLDRLQQGFTGLSLEIQSKFAPALRRAQDQAIAVNETITRTGAIAVQQFRAAEQAVNSTSTALQRLSEFQKQAGAGLTGRELQFSSPAALKALQDAAAASQRAGGLSPAALADGGIARQVQRLQTFRDAIARTAAEVEELRLRPSVDLTLLAAAEKRLNNIIATTTKAQQQLDNAVEISQNVGAATQLRSTTDPTGRTIQQRVADINRAREAEQAAAAAAAETEAAQRRIADATRARLAVASQLLQVDDRESELISRRGESVDVRARVQGQAAVRRAVEEEAAFRQRAADAAEREAAAVERLSQSQNRLLAQEIQRNSGASARRNAAAFDASTAGVLNRQAPDAGVFERQTRTLESELQRTAQLRQQFLALPADVQQSLEQERAALNNIGTAARAGAASIGLLAAANDRMAASIEEANSRLTEQERLARASSQLTINTDESDRLSRESGLERSAGASTRLIDRVEPSITALRDRIAGLADPLRESLGPQVDDITNRFRILARDGVDATGEAVQRITSDAAALNAALNNRQTIGDNFAASFGGAGAAGLSLGVDERSLRAIGGQIEFVQNRLSLLGQEARGPVLAALEALRVRANALFQGGAIDTEEARNELALLRQDLIRTLAAAEGGGTAGIEAGLNRAGDVGRLGVDKLQLGLQQAAFAVDDFFSVTGDLQQRIRAVGNNLTQLGFIVGNTKGLWIALGGVLALQVISQVIKYANANVEAADRTKALNEALARQKNLVEELAQAFRSLGDTILRGVFTPAADEARQFAQALEEIRKKQAEVRESRLTEFNPDVAQRRSEVQARQREFDAATTPEARLAAATALRQARDREQEAVRAAARPIPARRLDEEIQQAVQRSIDIERRSRTDFDTGALLGEDQFLEALRRGGRQAEIEAARAAGDGLGANRIQREELQTRLREVEALGDGPDSRQAALILREALNRLDFAEALGLDDAAREIFKDAGGTSTGIREAREKLSEAIEAGVPGARAASEALNAAGESLSAAQQRIIDRVEAGLPVDRELVDAARAEREAAQKALEARQKEVVAFDSTRQSLETFAEALDRVSTELANTVAQEARGLADQARRDANREQGIVDGGLGGRQGDAAAAAQRRDRLAAQAADFARRAAAIEAANTRARVDFARQAAAGGLGQRAQDLIRQRDQAQAVIDNRQSPADGVTNARATLNIINTELQQIFEQSGAGQAAAKLADELNKAAAAAARRDELIQRGRELNLSPAEQAGRELAEDIRAINERFAADADAAPQDRAKLLADAQADIARVREERFRQEAPAIFALADSVANAVLQGPSRAALEATDVSTVEGARELNRLLRGDDAARDQDLVELQKQSQALEELVRIAREGGAAVAD